MGFALELALDLKAFKAGLTEVRASLVNVARAPLVNMRDAFTPALQGFRDMVSAAQQAQLALGAAAAAMGLSVREALSSAASRETANLRFEAIFGDMTRSVREFSTELANASGRSSTAVRNMLSSFQILIEPITGTREEAAALSKEFAQLAVDISAFMGVSEGEVAGNLSAAMHGMDRSVREYGIRLSEVNVKQAAFAQGLDPEMLTEAQMQMIRLNLILQQSERYHGAAAKNVGTLTEGMTRLKNATQGLVGDIGGLFRDAVLGLAQSLTGAVAGVRSWIAEHSTFAGVLVKVATAVGAVAAGFGLLLPIVGIFVPLVKAAAVTLAGLAAAVLSPIGALTALAAAFAALTGGLGIAGIVQGFSRFTESGRGAQQVLDGISRGARAVWDALKQMGAAIVEPFLEFTRSVGDMVFGRLEGQAGQLGSAFEILGQQVGAAISKISTWVREGLGAALEWLKPIAEQTIESLFNVFKKLPTIFEAAGVALNRMVSFFSEMFAILTGGSANVGKGFSSLQEIIVSAIQTIEGLLSSPNLIAGFGYIRIAVALISGGFGELWSVGRLALSGLIGLLGYMAKGVALVLEGMSKISDKFKGAYDAVNDFAEHAIDRATAMSEAAQQKILDIAKRTAKEIESGTYDVQMAEQISRQLRANAEARRQQAQAAKEAKKDAEGEKDAVDRTASSYTRATNAVEYHAEAVKRAKTATEEAEKAEAALQDARVKATITIRDDLELLRQRTQLQLAQAQSEQERAAISRRAIAEETALIEDQARRIQEDFKRRSESLQEFLAQIEGAHLEREGRGVEATLQQTRAQFLKQVQNITAPEELEAFRRAVKYGFEDPLNELRSAAQAAQSQVASAHAAAARGTYGPSASRAQEEANRLSALVAQVDQIEAEIAAKAEESLRSNLARKAEVDISALRDTGAPAGAEDLAGLDAKIQDAGQTIGAASGLAEQVKQIALNLSLGARDLAQAFSINLEPLRVQIGQLVTDISGFGASLGQILPSITIGIENILTEQALFAGKVGTFADTAFGKFVETTDGLRGHRLELDGIIAKLEALRILEAARGQADAGLTTAGFSH